MLRKNILSILPKGGTSKGDLQDLAKYLNIQVSIEWKHGFNDAEEDLIILNIGGRQPNGSSMGGTHWVAVDKSNKRYYDPLGFPPVSIIPNNYEYSRLEIQKINENWCGQYCMLWLLYSHNNELDQYYNLFNIA